MEDICLQILSSQSFGQEHRSLILENSKTVYKCIVNGIQVTKT